VLCNACGLRYSKYRRVCMQCNKVGVKANFEKVSCPKCKSSL
ncbi:putative Zinc finger, GATA-type protein, partial [Trachipleistophora hominis]